MIEPIESRNRANGVPSRPGRPSIEAATRDSPLYDRDGDVFVSVPDLLRLLAVPVLGWAAWHDIQTRRVPNRTWLPLAALAAVLLFWDGVRAFGLGGLDWTIFAVGASISLLVVAPAAYLFWRVGAFGGADAKALIVLAALFPTAPVYQLGGVFLPLRTTPTGAFALTILSNTVLVGACYPLWLAVHNVTAGRLRTVMFLGRPVRWDAIPATPGRLLETRSGYTLSGLDLDALRMYLRWRGTTLVELRRDPDRYRRPESLPEAPFPPGDGSVVATGERRPEPERSSGFRSDGGRIDSTDRSRRPRGSTAGRSGPVDPRDNWGARAFLADVGSAYGTTPEGLCEGLELLTSRDRVWISPGIPFIIPILLGLVIALTYGDLLIAALVALGLG